MKTVSARDNQLIVVLSKKEAIAVLNRLNQHTGTKKSQLVITAQQKLLAEIQSVSDRYKSWADGLVDTQLLEQN